MYIKIRIDMRRSSFLSNECSNLFLSPTSESSWVSKESVRSVRFWIISVALEAQITFRCKKRLMFGPSGFQQYSHEIDVGWALSLFLQPSRTLGKSHCIPGPASPWLHKMTFVASTTPPDYHRIVSPTLSIPSDPRISVPVGLLACQRTVLSLFFLERTLTN